MLILMLLVLGKPSFVLMLQLTVMLLVLLSKPRVDLLLLLMLLQ